MHDDVARLARRHVDIVEADPQPPYDAQIRRGVEHRLGVVHEQGPGRVERMRRTQAAPEGQVLFGGAKLMRRHDAVEPRLQARV